MSRNKTTLALTILLSGAALLVPAVLTQAQPADKETKKARKKLKRNAKNLGKIQRYLFKHDKTIRESANAKQRDQADKAIEELAEKATQLAELIRMADNAKAVDVLLQFATFVPSDNCYDNIMREMRRFESDEAIEAMAEVLAGDLAGKKKKKKKRRKKKKKKKGMAAWKAQVMVAQVFEDLSHDATIEPIALQLQKGTRPEIVNACVEAAKYKEDPRIVDGLIALLGRVEKQGGWEYHNVRQRLTDLTGKDFFTQEKWSSWWGQNKGKFDFKNKGEVTEAQTRTRGEKEKVPTFFGSEIESNRLLFVIDVSGSMKMTDRPSESSMSKEDFVRANPDDPSIKKYQRIERAKRQVMGAIKNMVPTQKFNVIAFQTTLKYWRKPENGLAAATPANKAAALKWCEGLVEGGGTYTDQALLAAFRHEGVDTIYFLSDGAPMKKVGNPGEQMKQFAEEEIKRCLYLVREANRFRRVKIFSFGMDGPGVWHRKWGNRPVTIPEEEKFLAPLRKFMRDIASMTGGEYKSI